MYKTWKHLGSIRGLAPASVLLTLISFAGSPAYPQSEIDPDHFESPNVEPFGQGKTNPEGEPQTTHLKGEFALPYSVYCSGKTIRPGTYTLSLHFARDMAKASLNGEGRIVELVGVTHKQDRDHMTNAIILQREGVKRTLFAIHVSGWVFQPKPQDKNPSALQPVKFDKVSLTVPAQGTR